MSFRLGLLYQVTATTVVCCILMQILCVVSQKAELLGTSSARPPTGAPPWTAQGDYILQTPSFLLCPSSNPVRSTPLLVDPSVPRKRTIADESRMHEFVRASFVRTKGSFTLDPV